MCPSHMAIFTVQSNICYAHVAHHTSRVLDWSLLLLHQRGSWSKLKGSVYLHPMQLLNMCPVLSTHESEQHMYARVSKAEKSLPCLIDDSCEIVMCCTQDTHTQFKNASCEQFNTSIQFSSIDIKKVSGATCFLKWDSAAAWYKWRIPIKLIWADLWKTHFWKK